MLNILFSLLAAKTQILGIDLINQDDFANLLLRFILNTTVVIVIARYFYYAAKKDYEYLFTFILIGTAIFFLCVLLANIKLNMGFALGLFAVFGILRYRTSQISIKEMTYLFLIITVSVCNSLANKKVSYAELLFTNLVLLAIPFLIEKVFIFRHESQKTIVYENIENIKPENKAILLADLKRRTGLNIHKYEITRYNYLRDTARIKVYYYEHSRKIHSKDDENITINVNADDV